MNTVILLSTLLIGQIQVPDGSLIYCQFRLPPTGPVERVASQFSGDLGHAAITLDGFVYEATWPRVIRTPLKEWIEKYDYKGGRRSIFIMVPKTPFSQAQVANMRNFAISQLNRRYMARGLWQDRETEGTFCSKYASEVLEMSGLIRSANHRETPLSLYNKTLPYYNFLCRYRLAQNGLNSRN